MRKNPDGKGLGGIFTMKLGPMPTAHIKIRRKHMWLASVIVTPLNRKLSTYGPSILSKLLRALRIVEVLRKYCRFVR